MIDYHRLIPSPQMNNMEEIQACSRRRVDEAITGMDHNRERKCIESIAVGNERFIKAIKSILVMKAKGWKTFDGEKSFELR